jgi:hypothetical protein
MEAVFIACAALGGTLMVGQFILGLVGIGHHADFDHDFSGDVGHDFGGHDAGHHGADGHHGSQDDAHSHADHGSNWFLKALSVRTLVAAVTFFGLAGLASIKADVPATQSLLIACAAGVAALYGVYYIMQSLYRLKADGTERINRAIGTEGTVYLTIPGNNAGTGKIHFTLQNRLVEYPAVTAGETLPTGTSVVVVGLVGPDTVQVEPTTQEARTTHA